MEFCQKVLGEFKIVPTLRRIELLKLMLTKGNDSFSLHELRERAGALDLAISDSTIATTLLLFESRRLLKSFNALRTEKKRGRSMALYMLNYPLK